MPVRLEHKSLLTRIVDQYFNQLFFDLYSSDEGEVLTHFQHPLRLQDEGRVLVIFPLIVSHVIDSQSPLYSLSAKDFLNKRYNSVILYCSFMNQLVVDSMLRCRFEIIITFTGASPSTGQTTEERTSYLSKEIGWGHRFVNMIDYDHYNKEYVVDYDKFDITEEVKLCALSLLGNFIHIHTPIFCLFSHIRLKHLYVVLNI